jgi:predicted Zn-dependent protease
MSHPVIRLTTMTFFSASLSRRLGSLLLLACLALPLAAAAQQTNPSAQPSERAAADLTKLQAFVDTKNWAGALALLNGMLEYAAPNSYDRALANDIISKIDLQKGDYAEAIKPMEQALQLGDAYKFFDEKSQLDRINYLAQLYYQEASGSKVKAVQEQNYTKANHYMAMWFKRTTKPTEEARLLYATLLYSQAVLDPNHPDHALLDQAMQQVHEGLLGSLHPKENFYVLQLASLQQEGKLEDCAKILELLVKQYPSKSTYWLQLMSTYANLASEEKQPDKAREYNLRAIITIERAQALGLMNTPKDNYNLVGIYFNIGQYSKATELLYKGLKDGSIDGDIKKWELLAYSYQQFNHDFQAIDVLKEAAQHFPKEGQLDNQIAQIYYSLDKVSEAYKHLNLALAKGHLEKPGSVYYFLAYICFELQKYDEALTAVTKAAEFKDSQDTQLPRLRQAIQDAIKEREAAKSAGKK